MSPTAGRHSPGVSPYVVALQHALAEQSMRHLLDFKKDDLTVELCAGGDSIWVFIRREKRGGVALRVAFLPEDFSCTVLSPESDEVVRLRILSAMGEHVAMFSLGAGVLTKFRMTVRFTPRVAMLVPFMPRDLYPLDARGDPLGATGHVEAAQRGLNAGLLYFRISEPAFGNILYFQNLTAMNDYYRATKTKPDGAVGGEWPELGYLLPTPPQSGTPPTDPLPAGIQFTISDAILVFRFDEPMDERDSARQFLQMLGAAYQMLDLPTYEFRDWIWRGERTLHDLSHAPEATVRHYGHRYVRPYTNAEYPDVMVQMSLVAAIHAWGKWNRKAHPLEAAFKAGLGKFYDARLKTLRRYLPNVGDDKDADAVDSWYLYHPLLNLGILALDGDASARRLFLKSVGFGIRAARHFDYKWPVQYKVTNFSVITAEAGADGRGQTDVAGVYAWVMLQAFTLTDDKQYLDEARKAIDAAVGLRFNINYQANLTAWGAAACMRLWRITDREVYREQSYVYLASFLHNCVIWESEIERAVHDRNFLGVTCLQDAPYMAIYECFDSFVAFEHYLNDAGPGVEPAARMLIAEYCRYALDRAWYYYPDTLPPEAISDEQREGNGHIDRKLSFPLEDIYPDGQPAGQVGQEVYGAGAALIFATRAFHDIEGAAFRLYCDQFVHALERTGERTYTMTLHGGEHCAAGLSLVRRKRRRLPKVDVSLTTGEVLEAISHSADRIDYRVPAQGSLVITWQ